ncbi:hypothetical protein BGY98DRAFT_1176702 [Russula aff. rugulosa BPL654]|nr:hypothetical protein BGY98DRAFT_1176702 [Russula aff. rugulosa BPL654]
MKKQGCIPENLVWLHSKQAQAPLHSGLLATSSRRNPRPFVIDLHRAEAQPEKTGTLRANQAGTQLLCDDSGFAVNKAGVHLPFLMQARADMVLSYSGTNLDWLVREQCAVCNTATSAFFPGGTSVHTDVKYYLVPTPTSVGSESNEIGMSTTANSLGAILDAQDGLHPVSCKFQIPRDKKPRGEADRFSLMLGAAWEETRQHIPKGLPPEWKFADRYSIPPLVIVFTPRHGVGIENRASQWGEKANAARIEGTIRRGRATITSSARAGRPKTTRYVQRVKKKEMIVPVHRKGGRYRFTPKKPLTATEIPRLPACVVRGAAGAVIENVLPSLAHFEMKSITEGSGSVGINIAWELGSVERISGPCRKGEKMRPGLIMVHADCDGRGERGL